MTLKLQGLSILNTRPIKQGRQLSLAIEQAGGIAIDCPAIDIKPATDEWLKTLPRLEQVKWAIFVSVNAVEFTFKTFNNAHLKWPQSINVVAIGANTASMLSKYGVRVHDCPRIAESECLIQLPLFKEMSHQPVLLFKGKGGRTLIENTIIEKDGKLSILDVYERVLPFYDQTKTDSIWQNDAVNIILITSEQAMKQLFIIFRNEAHTWLRGKPCLVISNRLAKAATQHGLHNIIVSSPLNIFDTLCDYNQGLIHGQE